MRRYSDPARPQPAAAAAREAWATRWILRSVAGGRASRKIGRALRADQAIGAAATTEVANSPAGMAGTGPSQASPRRASRRPKSRVLLFGRMPTHKPE